MDQLVLGRTLGALPLGLEVLFKTNGDSSTL